ncbi:acyl carrier protein [Youngiibacter multivorans]|jgi:acyl carrier protein|uniref:Acyl carrier protein n=1 Tax=Youngiibacter multivorans TaxID=937251 RepID=A0ABS4G2P6_9CLOT|nr:acyl carrier protein [Youngiibacter multivorans]MBP1918821.1 acyl carrier protein [Youngiibacter multivorans]
MIFEKVREILAKELNIPADEITMESNFSDDLGIDSLDLVQLVMELEEAFDITIDDAEAIKTVKDAVNYVEAKTA